jgi:uncharacterized protein YoaH (UPF0181 family)
MAMVEKMLDLMDRVEAIHSPILRDTLLAGMREIASQMRETHLPVSASAEFRRRLTGALGALWAQSITDASQLVKDEFAEGLKAVEVKTDLVILRSISDFIQAYGQRQVEQITRTTEEQIRLLIVGGMSRGEAIQAVYANFLERLPAMTEMRSLLITRTEIHAATQYASLRMALRSTVPLNKVWNSVNDERTRDFGELGRISQFNHRSMDQVKIGLTQEFLVPAIIGGYERLAFPGDPRGSAGNIINCRCVQTYERASQ